MIEVKTGTGGLKMDRIFEIRALTEMIEPVVTVSGTGQFTCTCYSGAGAVNPSVLVAYNNKGWGPFSHLLALGSRLMEQPLS